jgi:hypothetical protein
VCVLCAEFVKYTMVVVVRVQREERKKEVSSVGTADVKHEAFNTLCVGRCKIHCATVTYLSTVKVSTCSAYTTNNIKRTLRS